LAQLSVPKRERKKVNFIVKTLDSAYKYNELVVPKVEKYFKKLKISGLLYDEIDKNVYKNIKEKSKKARSLLFIKNQRIILSRKEARKIEKIIEERIKKAYQKLKEFRGLAASSGNFKGKVRRILDLDKLDQCQKNDVLVTTMTRPQFNKYIKQVGAIITDEGGMLCHASMLAREFKIPCIVGTKIATKVLKDGDLVEVDAGRGVVKILKK
jgi:pyruvate,water dikinase